MMAITVQPARIFSLSACLLLAFGCGSDQNETAPPAPGTGNPPSQQPPAASSLEQSPDEQTATPPQGYFVHEQAGRSPFLLPDEQIELIQPKTLGEDPFANAIDPADIPAVVPWDKAERFVGYEILVEGKIVNVGATSSGSVNFLNFDKDYRGKFYMVVFEDLAKTLDQSVKDTFLNKTVRVRGKVELHRDTPQIRILSMDQVEQME